MSISLFKTATEGQVFRPADFNQNMTDIETAVNDLESSRVKNTTNETIAGVKTFSSPPVVPAPVGGADATNKTYVDGLDATNVHLTGNETVAGVKTFSSSPVVPTPSGATDAANKTYVDGYAAPVGHVGSGGAAHADAVAGGADGFMTGTDKTKLDGISSGAEVNQNAFSNVAVQGQVTLEADSKTDTVTLIPGANITMTTDPVLGTVTVNATGTVSTAAADITVADAGGYYTGANAEAALQEVGASLALKAPLDSPAQTGTPTVPTAAVDTNTTQSASTAFVIGQASSSTPLVDGVAAIGSSKRYARADHVHPASQASGISITDSGFYFTGTDVETALQEAGSQLAQIVNRIDNNSNVHYVVWDTVNATCTRGGASAGVATTTTNFGHFGSVNANYNNPFDNFYPWNGRKLCNVDIPTYRSIYAAHGNLLDCVIAWEGDVDFKIDGTNGFVGVYTPEFWALVKLIDGTKWFIGVSPVPVNSWTHYEETIGGRWFGVADGAGITSKPGLAVVNETMSGIHARATAYDMTLDDIYTWSADSILLAVEYATMNYQAAIGSGADSVYVQTIRPYISETAVNRVVMTDAQAANFRTGVMIDIGTTDGAYNIARRIVTTVEDYTPNSSYAIVNFDGAAVNIDTAHYVSAHGTSNLADSSILSTSGYVGANGKANAYYRGRVAHGNYWRYVLGAYRKTGNGRIWIADSRVEAASYDALNTGAHTDTGFDLPATSNYISSLHMLTSGLYPFAKTVGGASDKPVGDYCYVPSLATENTVLHAGGNSVNGAYAGRFYGNWYYAASHSSWYFSGLPFLKTP